MNILVELFIVFFKLGAFTIGGGIAMLPLLQNTLINEKKWFTKEEFVDTVAVCQSLPGVVAINMATYVGYKKKGLAGSLVSTLGVTIPSFVMILIIAKFLEKFRTNRLVEGAFYGLRPASLAMISVAGLNVARVALVNIPAFQASGAVGDLFLWKAIALGVALFIAQKKLKWHPVIFIAISAVIGIVFRF